MYEYKIYAMENNGWEILDKIENEGEQTVLKIKVGEKIDVNTGEITPLYEMIFKHIADAKDLFSIETNEKEFPLIRVKKNGRYIPHNTQFAQTCENISKAADSISENIRVIGLRDLSNMAKKGIQITNSKEFIKSNIFKYEIQEVLKSDKPYSFDYLADVLILRREEQLKTKLHEADDAKAALYVQNYYEEMCSLILQLDKKMITMEEMKKKASEIMDLTPAEINPQFIRTECVREGWKRSCLNN